jgi:hypothetical protein
MTAKFLSSTTILRDLVFVSLNNFLNMWQLYSVPTKTGQWKLGFTNQIIWGRVGSH